MNRGGEEQPFKKAQAAGSNSPAPGSNEARWDFSPVAYGPIQAGRGRCGVRGGAP
jgi:hypothetical protein